MGQNIKRRAAIGQRDMVEEEIEISDIAVETLDMAARRILDQAI
jgi:hypothetical protein